MIKKIVVIIAASALACGLWASGASAKTNHKAKPKQATATKVEAMKPVPGQNPTPVAPTQQPVKNAQPPQAIKGSNPMGTK